MLVTEFGMEILCNERHQENALSPILVTEFGMEISCNDLHQRNALSPMLVTEFGMINVAWFDINAINVVLSAL